MDPIYQSEIDRKSKTKRNIIAVFLSFIIVFGLVLGYFWTVYPTTTPFKSFYYFLFGITHPHQKMTKQVTGFLPYWRLEDIKYLHFDLLSEIIYFSLSVNDDGEIIKVVGNETNPGWFQWNSSIIKDLIAKTQLLGGRFSLVIAAQNNKIIENVLDSETAQNKLIKETIYQIKTRHLNGIVLDFEFLGNPDAKYQEKFTKFSTNLDSAIKSDFPNVSLSLTLLPLSGRHPGLFDLPKLIKIYDRFIGMSYDYYSSSSDIAGPIAPMNGFKEEKYFYDISTTYKDYQKYIPAAKIIMGIPYYGWYWPVENASEKLSKTLIQNDKNGYAVVMSYGRMKQNQNLKQTGCHFDELAKENWCGYVDPKSKVSHQVWFEDERSLGIKYDFAKKKNFSGIAIWVLGYDKDFPNLWNLLKERFATK